VLRVRYRVRVKVRGNTFKHVFIQTSIWASVLDPIPYVERVECSGIFEAEDEKSKKDRIRILEVKARAAFSLCYSAVFRLTTLPVGLPC